ncbi:MAG: DsbA family protein [Dongiaceae bacterium]
MATDDPARTLTVTLYWSFRSPYSYVLLPRILDLREQYRVTVDLRIVHPAAIRNPSYFARMDPLARPYFLSDSARAAAFHDLPFRRPVPDPIEQNPVTLAIAPTQPLALRLGRLGIEAVEQKRGLEFAREVSRLLWDGSVNGWDRGAHLADAAARAGLDLHALEAAIAKDPAPYDARLTENDRMLRAAGHWGVPAMVFDGEIFFGQDRFDMLLWRLRQQGLAPRPSS